MSQQKFYEDVTRKLQAGRADEAIADLQKWLAGHEGDEVGTSLLGSALLRAGKDAEAITTFRDAAAKYKRSFAAHGDLGFALAQTGANLDAIASFEKAVELNPDFYPGWVFLARLRHQTGDLAAARKAQVQGERCDPFTADFRLSQQAMSDGRFADAEKVCRGLLQRQPGYPPAAYTLAHLASKVGAHEEAARILRQALSFYPADAHLYSALVVSLEESGDYTAAVEAARVLVALEPGKSTSWLILGRVHGHCGNYDECIETYDKALKLARGNIDEIGNTEMLRGHILKILGRYDESVAAYRASANMIAGNGAAWWGLADMKTLRFDDGDIGAMTKIVNDDRLKLAQRAQAAFALGKAHEDRQRFDDAFDWYRRGNELRDNVDFDAAANRRGIESIIEAFEEPVLGIQAEPPPSGPTPIFVLGLPRAGSTLVEQILASHSAIEGTMELATLPNIVRRITIDGGRREQAYPASMASFDAAELAAYGQAYIDATATYRSGKAYFIDKLPTNFDKIGLIHKILPQAIIIDARRHPMDCGFSCYKQHFAGGHHFSYDLGDIGAYFNDYLAMMDHWDRVLPGKVFLAQYEQVVADIETVTRALLAHCGVAFEEACLRFFENKRPVRTASSEQVRQPIYASGVGYWRNFSAHLAPLETALGAVTLARFAQPTP